MKILHLADLHIGKRVNDYLMINDQKFVFEQIYSLIRDEQIEAILIAGDVFDKAIPAIVALELFNHFLDKIFNFNIPIFIIAGNHDSAERLSFLSNFLKKSNIHIVSVFDGEINKIRYGNLNFYLLPFVYPALIRQFYPAEEISNYNDAIEVLIKNTSIDEKEVNILLAHQFVVNKEQDLILSDSEAKSVGGVDWVSYSLFEKFDYVALGHLHCPQKVGLDKIRYGGSLLKYSFSEANQKKCFTIIEIDENKKLELKFKEIKFLHDLKEYRGKFDDFLKEEFYLSINKDDYIHFILEDEMVIDAKKKLSLIYPNIMLLEFDNNFTRNLNKNFKINVSEKLGLDEYFYEFYKMQSGIDIDEDKKILVEDLIGEMNNVAN